MNQRQKNIVSSLSALGIAVILVFGLGIDLFGWMFDEPDSLEQPPEVSATVTQVIDGDTIEVRLGTSTQRVRLIGIDAPEITWPNDENNLSEPEAECFGFPARDYLTDQIGTSSVALMGDSSQPEFDEYDRRLAYVFIDGELLNKALLEEGYARELTVGAGYERQADFQQAEDKARQASVGLWEEC